MERVCWTRYEGQRKQSSYFFSGCTTPYSQHISAFTNPDVSKRQHWGIFLRFPYVVWWIKSLAIGDWMWFPAPLSFRGGRWMEGEVLLIVLTLYSEDWFFWPSTATLKLPSSVIYLFIYYLYLFTRVALLAWTQVWSKGFIMNKRLAYHLGNSKGLRSPMPGAWDIHQILFNLYYTTQTQWRRE